MSSEALTAAITDGHAEVDEIAETAGPELRARTEQLLSSKSDRNLVMWKYRGVDQYLYGLTLEDIDRRNGGQHDDAYRMELSGLWAACVHQARIEISMREILAASDVHTRKVGKAASRMSRSERKAYAKVGPKKTEFKAAKERRKNGKETETAGE